MGKTIILNLSDVKLNGDVLDVGESFGVIYNLSKDIQDEISVDYIGSEYKHLLEIDEYDTCTLFFYLSNIWRQSDREKLFDEISKYVKEDGEMLIWDVNKEAFKVVNNKIRVLLPSGKVKEFEFKNLNPIAVSNIDDTKKSIEKNFEIEETKLWEHIYFIKARKRKVERKIE